jgi:hypothetical protein
LSCGVAKRLEDVFIAKTVLVVEYPGQSAKQKQNKSKTQMERILKREKRKTKKDPNSFSKKEEKKKKKPIRIFSKRRNKRIHILIVGLLRVKLHGLNHELIVGIVDYSVGQPQR